MIAVMSTSINLAVSRVIVGGLSTVHGFGDLSEKVVKQVWHCDGEFGTEKKSPK